MKYLIIIPIFLLGGCCDPGDEPSPPFGTPDDVSRYSSGEYKSVIYTYHCLNGEYVSKSYIRADACSDYESGVEFHTSGICPTLEQQEILSGLGSIQKLIYLKSIGMKIDTVRF